MAKKSPAKRTRKSPKKAKEIQTRRFFKNKRLTLLLFLALLAGLLYLGRGLFVAALVDGMPITRFKVIKELEKTSGKQTLDNLITRELILREGKKQSVSVTDGDVKNEIENIKKIVEKQGSTLEAALSFQGQTMAQLEEGIRMQKVIEAILKTQTEVTEDETKKYFEGNKSLYPANSKYEDVAESIKEQLKQEKLSSEYNKWIEKVKGESKILYVINY